MKVLIWNIFLSGGPFMWPILFFSVIAFALILERAVALIIFKNTITGFLLFLTSKGKSGKNTIAGIDDKIFSISKDQADELISEVFQLIVDKINRVIELIGGIGSISPLLGFIGTVYGMIIAFQSIANADRVSVKLVAGGISQALLTTGFGLAVAIVCLFFDQLYRFFLSSQIHRLETGVNTFFISK